MVDEVLRNGSPYPEWMLRTKILSRVTKSAPKHHATTYQDFEHVGRAGSIASSDGRERLAR